METAGVEPAPPRCKRGALPSGPRPQVVATSPLTYRGAKQSQHCPPPMPALPASAPNSTIDKPEPAHIPEQESEAVRWGAPRSGADNAVEPAPPRCKRGALPSEPRPQV